MFMGQWRRIRNEPSGAPAADWYVHTVANPILS